MNKIELINAVALSSDLSKIDSTKVIDSVLETITTTLKNGEKVEILGFGNFSVSERTARKGRNPQTGEEIEIAASKVPSFKAGKKLKDAVKGIKEEQSAGD
ncbi:HU family DNA-binding protein [Niallia taxi]|uniref:HU family DNA-binding protein n=1 Tax=Niallia taxi TaxID=2499688 RepID=A0A3S2W108_9BACI|nr:HU family DNA-binding protein [Niallia taxi]RVT57225.1 HU family DNA-binding protein [Niallia taxi]